MIEEYWTAYPVSGRWNTREAAVEAVTKWLTNTCRNYASIYHVVKTEESIEITH